MGQLLHGSARTTEAVRRAIQNSEESIARLAKRYNLPAAGRPKPEPESVSYPGTPCRIPVLDRLSYPETAGYSASDLIFSMRCCRIASPSVLPVSPFSFNGAVSTRFAALSACLK